jgi:hypothetical protein
MRGCSGHGGGSSIFRQHGKEEKLSAALLVEDRDGLVVRRW